MIRDRTAIVGIGSTEFARDIGRSEQQTALEAIRAALDDAGIEAREIDAIFQVDLQTGAPWELARNLAVPNLRAWASIGPGGGGACGPVVEAATAVATGRANGAGAYRAPNRGAGGRPWAQTRPGIGGVAAFEIPHGLVSPVQQIALMARRYLHEYKASPRAFARVAVAQRANAANNPRAIFRDPIDENDVLDSRMISDPLHLLDCCPETDGACAVIVTSAERARDGRQRPVTISAVAQGVGFRHYHMTSLYKEDPFDTTAVPAAKDLYAMADMKPGDVDVALLYDMFTPVVLYCLEAYGFCARGEAADFVLDGHIDAPHGSLPVNTHGGSLSEGYIHGFNHVLEGVRQLRGRSSCQIEGAEVALVAAAPGVPTSAVLLRRG